MSGTRPFERPDDSWMARGACVGHPNPDAWFPECSHWRQAPGVDEALRLCGGCPVRRECLIYGLVQTGAPCPGIYGGFFLPSERADAQTWLRASLARRGANPPSGR